MPHQLLNRTQVGTALEQVGRIGVPKRVRAEAAQPHIAQPACQCATDRRGFERAAARAQEQPVRRSLPPYPDPPTREPGVDGVERRPPDRDDPRTPPLPTTRRKPESSDPTVRVQSSATRSPQP